MVGWRARILFSTHYTGRSAEAWRETATSLGFLPERLIFVIEEEFDELHHLLDKFWTFDEDHDVRVHLLNHLRDASAQLVGIRDTAFCISK